MAVVALPHAPTSAAAARRRLVEELTELGLPQAVVADAEIVIAEMVGNAVTHGRPLADGAVRAAWELCGSELVLKVTDGGSQTRPSVGTPTDIYDEANGRGLAIVSAITPQWGSEPHAQGLQTWAKIGLL